MKNLFENYFEKELEIAAIWLDNSILTGENIRTNRITEDMTLTICDGKLCDTQYDNISHKVIGCFGNLNNTSLKFMLFNLKTFQPEIFKIK